MLRKIFKLCPSFTAKQAIQRQVNVQPEEDDLCSFRQILGIRSQVWKNSSHMFEWNLVDGSNHHFRQKNRTTTVVNHWALVFDSSSFSGFLTSFHILDFDRRHFCGIRTKKTDYILPRNWTINERENALVRLSRVQFRFNNWHAFTLCFTDEVGVWIVLISIHKRWTYELLFPKVTIDSSISPLPPSRTRQKNF